MFYVYGYFESNSSLPFYIGKGLGDRAYKFSEHTNNPRLSNKLRKLGDSLDVHIFDSDLSEEAAFHVERYLIQKFGRLSDGSGCLLNLTEGGTGFSGGKHSEEFKQKQSKRMKGNKHSLGTISSLRKPVVAKYFGMIVRRYSSILETEKSGFKCTNIVKVLKGKAKTAYGYVWEYQK